MTAQSLGAGLHPQRVEAARPVRVGAQKVHWWLVLVSSAISGPVGSKETIGGAEERDGRKALGGRGSGFGEV